MDQTGAERRPGPAGGAPEPGDRKQTREQADPILALMLEESARDQERFRREMGLPKGWGGVVVASVGAAAAVLATLDFARSYRQATVARALQGVGSISFGFVWFLVLGLVVFAAGVALATSGFSQSR